MEVISPFKNFINNAKLLHHNRYDYKYIEYIDNKTEVYRKTIKIKKIIKLLGFKLISI